MASARFDISIFFLFYIFTIFFLRFCEKSVDNFVVDAFDTRGFHFV